MPAEPVRPSRRCAVLGSPIAHSLSPVLHRAAYRELHLDWSYDSHEVVEDQLAAFLGALTAEWRGLSLTMPLKRRAVDLCDEVAGRGRMLASVNTVVIDDNGALHGHNTDVAGFVGAFREAGVEELTSVVVVGTGATAASALAAACDLGARRVTLLGRSIERATALARLGPALGLDIDLHDLAHPFATLPADAVISTIPAQAHASVAVDVLASLAPVVFDVNYAPAHTSLTDAARARGGAVVEGFALLLHQAARQVELMTGTEEAPIAAMRAAGMAALARS